MKTGLMTMHVKVFATLGEARKNKNTQKIKSFRTWQINFY